MNPFGFGPWGAGFLTVFIAAVVAFCVYLMCMTTWDAVNRICDSVDDMWASLVEIAKEVFGTGGPSKHG